MKKGFQPQQRQPVRPSGIPGLITLWGGFFSFSL
jgi:hypothetical protein